MKTTKMSLANIQGKLSRAEMKNIMAGSGGKCGDLCFTADDCPDSSCGQCNSHNGGSYVCT
jgi:hypothetical protein